MNERQAREQIGTRHFGTWSNQNTWGNDTMISWYNMKVQMNDMLNAWVNEGCHLVSGAKISGAVLPPLCFYVLLNQRLLCSNIVRYNICLSVLVLVQLLVLVLVIVILQLLLLLRLAELLLVLELYLLLVLVELSLELVFVELLLARLSVIVHSR